MQAERGSCTNSFWPQNTHSNKALVSIFFYYSNPLYELVWTALIAPHAARRLSTTTTELPWAGWKDRRLCASVTGKTELNEDKYSRFRHHTLMSSTFSQHLYYSAKYYKEKPQKKKVALTVQFNISYNPAWTTTYPFLEIRPPFVVLPENYFDPSLPVFTFCSDRLKGHMRIKKPGCGDQEQRHQKWHKKHLFYPEPQGSGVSSVSIHYVFSYHKDCRFFFFL